MKRLTALAGLPLLVAPAMAETITCQSAPQEFPVLLSVERVRADDSWSIKVARFQIEGDIGYATDHADPTGMASIASPELTDDSIRFSFHYRDAGYDGDVAELWLVSLAEGQAVEWGGVLSVVAGGVWPVICESVPD